MSYINAEKELPPWLLNLLRTYVSEGVIYIPPVKTIQRAWGSRSGARQLLDERNKEIRAKKCAGAEISDLAKEYYLSEETIKRILKT